MKKRINLLHPLLIFIGMQIVWLSLLGIWIYWYISNYSMVREFGQKYLPQFFQSTTRMQLFTLIVGLILLVFLLVGMYFVFIYLTRQININLLYENFIANFTHELKSPLASIQLYLETMSKREIDRKTQMEFLERMLMDTQRLKRVIDAILDISQIEQKKKLFSPELVEAGQVFPMLIKHSLHQFKIPSEKVKINIKTNACVELDQNAWQIIFSNLFDNALKYSVDDLNIQINIYEKGKNLVIEFKDNGIGILPEDQKHLFQKFFRVNRDHLPNVRGTGLGLYHVREIVRHHNGKISVYSDGIGKGTTFTILLPKIKNKSENSISIQKKGKVK